MKAVILAYGFSIRKIISRLVLKQNKDSICIKQIKNNFSTKLRPCRYGRFKTNVDSIIAEAAPGVMETVITELDKRKTNDFMKVLNLGGGMGQMSPILEFMGFDTINIDIAIETENAKNIKVDLNSASHLPLPEKSFDFVICQEVIEHLENPWSLFRLIRKHIKPKGCFILTTPNVHSLISKTIFKKTNYFKWFLPENLGYHINPLPFWEIKLIAERTGFNLIELKGNADYFWGRTGEKPTCVLNKNDILIFIFEECKQT